MQRAGWIKWFSGYVGSASLMRGVEDTGKLSGILAVGGCFDGGRDAPTVRGYVADTDR
jgi:hypothetical protein